jgi:hypothetical protein
MTSKPIDLPTIPREQPSTRWFLTGFIAVVLAGIAKVAIADYFDNRAWVFITEKKARLPDGVALFIV